MNLGNKIRELRHAGGLTQEQLAATLNVSPQAVSKWEMGASYPDITMIPVLAGLFRVSIDEFFNFDIDDIDKKIENIRLEYNKYFWGSFEKAEQILIDGLKLYPASVKLKTELFELYTYNVHRSDEILNKAFELYGQILQASQDIFCTCRTKANMILIYNHLERKKGEDHYEEIKKIIETLPYMYPYMIQDKMRLSASFLKGEEGMKEAKSLKEIEWQEFFIACAQVGIRYFELEDYENALISLQQSADAIELLMYPEKQGCDAYPIHGTHSNHSITLLQIAACLFRLGRKDGLDELIERSKHIYFDAYEHIEKWNRSKDLPGMIDYFTEQYNNLGLDKFKPLDLSCIKARLE